MKKTDLTRMLAAAGALVLTTLGSAHAGSVSFDVAGVQSNGGWGDPANTVVFANIGAGAVLTNVSWTVNVTAFAPSWLSEVAFSFGGTGDYERLYASVGFGENPGTATFSNSVSLDGFGFVTGSDGKLNVEYFDSYPDASVNPDAVWNSGTITFDYTAAPVPEPATFVLMAGGLGLLGWGVRRRG